MMREYQEDEVKVLGVDPRLVCRAIERLGANKVFEGKRVFTTFDDKRGLLVESGRILRLTEEERLKLSVSFPVKRGKETVKLFVSRKKEAVDLLATLDFFPIAEVKSRRISYEWGKVDFDLDIFPEIPPFLEIDKTYLKTSLDELLAKLGLENKELFYEGTEAVYRHYGVDYFDCFKVKKLTFLR